MKDPFSCLPLSSLHYDMTDKESGTKYTVLQVGQRNIPSLLLCTKYVEQVSHAYSPVLHIFTVLHNSSEGMFLCVPVELYILSSCS